MKRATALPAYRNLQDFAPPDGVTVVDIDPDTLQLATPACPVKRQEVFVTGTEPTEFCEKHGGRIFSPRTGVPSWLSRLFGGQPKADGNPNPDESSSGSSPDDPSAKASSSRNEAGRSTRGGEAAPDDANSEEKKPGLLQRVFGGIFGGKRDQDNSNGSSPDPGR